jgi:hypothetical protein
VDVAGGCQFDTLDWRHSILSHVRNIVILQRLPLRSGLGVEVEDLDLAVAGEAVFETILPIWQAPAPVRFGY